MKNVIIPLLLIGMLFSASFGLVMMNHTDEMGHSQCPFEAVGVADCSKVQNTIDFLNSHLNALANFFSATPVNGFAISLSLLLALALAVFINFDKNEALILRPVLFRSRLRESFIPSSRTLFNHWLSLHENSPTSLVGR